MGFKHGFDCLDHISFVPNITNMSCCPSTILGDFQTNFLKLIKIASDQSHRCSQTGQLVRGTTANAAAASSYNGNLSIK